MEARTLAALALPLLLATAPARAEERTARALLPLDAGNVWEYEVAGAPGEAGLRVEVLRRHGGWAEVSGLLGRRWWWPSERTAQVWLWNEDEGGCSRALSLGLGDGNRFTAQAPSLPGLDQAVFEVVARRARLTTPAGVFDECLVLERAGRAQPAARSPRAEAASVRLGRIALAPGVGPVELELLTPDGPVRAGLRHATVAGRTIPRPGGAGLATCLHLGQFELDLADPARATLELTLRVENGHHAPIAFTFRTEQRYEVIVRDDGGREVHRAARARPFARRVHPLQLRPGEVWTFEESLALGGDEAPLPPGEYSVEMRLASDRPVGALGRFRIVERSR